jgi:hypothetical protein
MNQEIIEKMDQQDRIEYYLEKENNHSGIGSMTYMVIIVGFIALNCLVTLKAFEDIPKLFIMCSVTIGLLCISDGIYSLIVKSEMDRKYLPRVKWDADAKSVKSHRP